MQTAQTKTRWSFPAVPAALLSMISVQGGASIAKRLFPVLGATGTTTLRIGLSAIILLLVNRPKFSRLSTRQWLYSAGYGACLGCMNLVFYYAIQRIPLGLGVTVEFVGPLGLALLCSRRWTDVLWALMAATGILLIVPWDSTTGIDLWGLLLALAAGTFWAFYIVMGGKISRIMDKREAVSVGMCFATLVVLPMGLLSGDLAALNGKYLLIGLCLSLLSSAIPYTLDMIALGKLPPKTFSILMSLQPAFAALSGLIFLKEFLTLNQWLSILCVIVASVGATLTAKK